MTEQDARRVNQAVDRFVEIGVSKQPAKALADYFDSEEAVVEFLTEDKSLTDISGVGEASASQLWNWYQAEYPEKDLERREQSEAYCTEYTIDHGLDQEQLDPEHDIHWAWLCPRCGSKNPMKGDPDGFKGRPFACVNCRWVPLLDGEALAEFRDGLDGVDSNGR